MRSHTTPNHVEDSAATLRGHAGVTSGGFQAGPRPTGEHPETPLRADGAPTVVIIANNTGEYLDQLASTLRRRHVRVIRVFGPGAGAPAGKSSRARWLRDRLLYDRAVRVPESASVASLERRLGNADVVDVLVSETALVDGRFRSPAVAELARRGLAFAEQPPEALLDKFAVNERLARKGLRTPAQFRVADLGMEEAIARLGLPLVVKKATGAAGSGVRCARTIDQVACAVTELAAPDPRLAFYQQHINGQMMMYVCVRGAAGPLLEQGLEVLSAQSPLGPSASVRLVDDPVLLSAGRSVAKALGCQGFADIGFVRDGNGDLWHVDANCRAWGNMVSLLGAGLDFTEAYLALLKRAPLARRPSAAGQLVHVLPFALHEAVLYGARHDIWSRLTAFARMCQRGPGLGYASLIALKALAELLTRALRSLPLPKTSRRGGQPA